MQDLFLKDLPTECRSFLIDKLPHRVEKVAVLRERKQHAVYRIYTQKDSFVLKCFQPQSVAKEIQVYDLLQENKIPTLPCYGITDNALLLEDLESSESWRCADERDMKLSTTGEAVANWYRRLHTVGFEVVRNAEETIGYLQSWIGIIQQKAMEIVGNTLEVADSGSWKLALSSFEALKEKYQSFPQTFNYNDFAAENLALSATHQREEQAIVYDYDQFGVGAIYSDWRNVTYSLQEGARDAFVAAYGEVSESERRIDNVLSILQGLIIAVDRDRFPNWALPLRKSIENGELERKIYAALEIL